MNKLTVIVSLCTAALALAPVSCARMEYVAPAERAISFAVAKQATRQGTRAEIDYADSYGSVPFGAYAWYKGAIPANDADFMTNQKVSFDGLYWAPEGTTYYWPGGGSLDFVCYSPYSAAGGPAVSEDAISWNSWDILDNEGVDLMYATKATGLTGPVKTAYYYGVPTIFHHALAQVAFNVRLAYDEVTAPTGDKTRWKVTFHGLTLYNVATKGSLTLTLDEDGSWKTPDGGVWTPEEPRTNFGLGSGGNPQLAAGQTYSVGEPMTVLPQPLTSGGISMTLDVSIATERDGGSGYQPFLQEDHVLLYAQLGNDTLKAWGMNQRITYNIVLAPSKATTDGVDTVPAEVIFDPAVGDWDDINIDIDIQL